MSYGSPDWQKWVLPAADSYEHIKVAYDAGINTFDTGNHPFTDIRIFFLIAFTANVYSNGESEKILGEAIKKYDLPREELVILTKVRSIV